MLIHFFCINQTDDTTTFSFYYIEKQDVEVGGLTYLTVSHEDAEFEAFQGPIYDINDNLQTEEDFIGNSFYMVMEQSDAKTHVSNGYHSFGDVYISKLDTGFSVTKLELWGTERNRKISTFRKILKCIHIMKKFLPPSNTMNCEHLSVWVPF